MKQKASEATDAPVTEDTSSTSEEVEETAAAGDKPMYNAIVAQLQTLQPTLLELVDNSQGKETNFDLTIVAEAFDGLNIIKRQQLIYMMLGEVMPKIESLQIQAMTPDEAGK